MKRWLWRGLILGVLVACASDFGLFSQELKSLPESASGWRLTNQAIRKPVPEDWKNFRSGEYARKAWRGEYSGTPPMTVTVYDMPRYPGAAFNAIQQWQVAPGRMAFLKGGYFGIAESPAATRDEFERFVRGLDAALPRGNEMLR